jgi:hypothetical protein
VSTVAAVGVVVVAVVIVAVVVVGVVVAVVVCVVFVVVATGDAVVEVVVFVHDAATSDSTARIAQSEMRQLILVDNKFFNVSPFCFMC